MLARLPRAQVRALYPDVASFTTRTGRGPDSPGELRRVLAEEYRRGWSMEDGPFFANHICLLEFREREARMLLERAEPDDEGRPTLTVAAESKL